MTTCADAAMHRSRVEGRVRGIPGWYELEWDHVERSRSGWEPPDDVDLVLEAGDPIERNAGSLRGALGEG